MPMQVNVTTQVNSKQIRKITHNGREHWVLPSYTLPANVIMNGGLYTNAEIDAHYKKLEGTLAPLGHPQVNGKFVSAFSPEGINVGHIGAFNRNVRKEGSRIYVEKWIDVEFAKNTEGGRRLLERVEALERGDNADPIHTSVAVFLERLEANEDQRKQGAEWVAKILEVDHDAILLDQPGAATPEQGVGLMVNADLAVSIDQHETETPRWFQPFYEQFKKFFNPQASPAVNLKEGNMPLSPEERAELVKEIGAAVTPIVNGAVAEAVKPLSDQVAALQANQTELAEQLTANQKAEEVEKRKAVAEKYGEVVANSLQGEALDAMYKTIGEAAPLGSEHIQANSNALVADVNALPKE